MTKSGKDCRLQLNPPRESWSQGRFSSSFVHFELTLPPSLLFAQLSPCPSIRAGQHNSKLSRSFHRVGLEYGLGLDAWSWPIWFGLVLVVWDCSRRVEHTITLHPHLDLAYLVWFESVIQCTYHHVAPSPNQLLPTTGQYCKLFTPSARQQGGHSCSQHQQKSCMNFTTSIKFHLFFVYFCSESSNILWQCCSLKVSFVMRWKFWINLMIFKDCEYPLSPFLSLSPNCQSDCGNQWDPEWHNAENVWDNRRRGLKRWIAKYGQRASPSLSVLFCHNISAAIVLQLLLRVQPVQCPPWTNTMKPACLQTESRCHWKQAKEEREQQSWGVFSATLSDWIEPTGQSSWVIHIPQWNPNSSYYGRRSVPFKDARR